MGIVAERRVRAVNTAPDSGNRIHGDDVAADLGFRGGLVPGVDVWAYLSRPAMDSWGEDWLRRGAMQARFVAPVHDGEDIVATMDDAGALVLTGPDGDAATGWASMPEPPGEPMVIDAGPPSSRPPASAETLAVGTVMMPFRITIDGAKCQAYADHVGEGDSPAATLGVAHPALLLRFVNWILAYQVELGPWIHVQSEVQHHALVGHGAEVELRAVVTDLSTRGGHEFVDFDCVVLADDRPAMSVRHRAIWQLRGAGG